MWDINKAFCDYYRKKYLDSPFDKEKAKEFLAKVEMTHLLSEQLSMLNYRIMLAEIQTVIESLPGGKAL